ncbi:T9SS type A sorting domain-containing protein [Runella sp. SP2]|uniref:T9SS type A sorting domain-containing protein n=1 Tax=Runella sp. SP2 TaxID=2268026 RepID=UPI000F091244|nr:T9SS type A sorting domain-containing protein [Runella sp. SP2]AYQ33266.1 T9SS C-terminal target domain-containing protein [Runella sp. SP2]
MNRFYCKTLALFFFVLGLMLTFGSHAQTVRYVKVDGMGDGLSWATASSDLQAMINADGVQQVWVAAGTYKPIRAADGTLNPSNIRATSFKMKSGVAIYGGFAGGETTLNDRNWRTNATVLSGEHQGDDDIENNSYNVVLNFGNGLSSTSVLDGFTITGGNANGQFIIINAYGGGICNYEAGSPTIINCTFFENEANFGGGIYNLKSSTNLINCVFIGNQARFGGAMNNIEASPSVVNCSFSGNRANNNGGGAVSCIMNSYPSFKNCILWGNSSEIYKDESSTAIYTNTLVKGLVVGGFQGTEDPLFVGQPAVGLGTSGDLRLQACSPAINAGSNTDNTVTIDLDGNPRKVGVIDLGAYEYQSVPTAILPTVGTSNPTTCGGSNGSITLGGFMSNTLYSVAYKKDNTAVSATNFTSNSNGVITLTSLGTGNYTDIVATYGSCVSQAATASLQDPAKPALALSAIPVVCAGATSFTIPYGNETGSPNKYSISGTGIVAVSDGNLSNPITVTLSSPTSESSISFVLTVKNATTSCESSTITGSVTVNPVSVGGVVSSAQTICSGTAPADLSLSGQTGSVVKWQKSSDANFSTPIDIAWTATTLPSATIGSLAADTYFRAVVNSGVCSEAISSTVKITVNPVSVGGVVSSAQTICSGTAPADLSLSGQTGSVVKWQKSSDANFSTPIDIAWTATTLPSATIGSLATDTYFRAVVKSGVCSEVISSTVKITVNPVSVGGVVSSAQTICSGTAPADLSLSGQTGSVVKWQKSSDANFSTPIDIAWTATTLPSATIGSLAADTYFRAVVKSGVCSEAYSSSALIQIHRKPTITLSMLQQTLNEGNNPVLCDTDANPVNSLQFNVTGLCVSGSPVWRSQVGNSTWSDWSTNAPISQPSNNQPHRYQAACDVNCPVTYTSPIVLTISYRASIPQNVSMIADGMTVNEGETKEVCNIEGNTLTFNATCASGEMLLYSVDGGDYSSVVPTQLVDGQSHNYRVRCRKSDGTVSCVETESGVMRLRIVSSSLTAPVASLNVTTGCGSPVVFSGITNCGALTTIWYNAVTNLALPSLPNQTPTETTSYYARCQAGGGCLSEKSNVVTYTVIPVGVAPAITASQDIVCMGTTVKISANCPAGSQAFWNTGVTASSFEVSFSNVTKQTYWAKCLFEGGCQSVESVRKDVYWNAFVVTLVNVGQPKSAVKVNDRAAWSSQFITRDGGPELEQSTQQNPTLYYVENANKVAPRYWTINVDACALGTDGSLTFDMLATPEMGVIRSFNTHENNAPYFMYANREGWTELYAQNHPAYGFYQDNGAGGNVYDAGLPKGLYKLGIRYWDQKGWGSIYPSTRKPQGNVLAYQEYWFRIQSKDGIGVGAARQVATGSGQVAKGKGQGADNGKQITDSVSFATVMPNPVTHMLRLKVQDSKGQLVQTSLTDATGREVVCRNFVPETNTHQEEFGVSALPTGMYFLKVTTAENQATLKVVKVH